MRRHYLKGMPFCQIVKSYLWLLFYIIFQYSAKKTPGFFFTILLRSRYNQMNDTIVTKKQQCNLPDRYT